MSRGAWQAGAPSAIAFLVLLVAACSTTPRRAPPPSLPAEPARAESSTVPDLPVPTQTDDEHPSEPETPWQRLRQRFSMPGCSDSAEIEKQARLYTRIGASFDATWSEAMPLLLLVLDEVEHRDLPGELALLPYVESRYRAVRGQGRGAAGIWQLMPRTAKDHGLHIGRDVDERLDAVASTRAALDLLEQMERRFSDWRLAIMAFNAGEYRVKAALGKRRPSTLSLAELQGLKVSRTTHQHLARLLALSCIVSDPERFGVELPAASERDKLQSIELAAPIDLRLAARLAGVSYADLLRFNPSAMNARRRAVVGKRLLLPGVHAEAFAAALERIPQGQRRGWHAIRLEESFSLDTLAATLGIPSSLLAAANRLGVNAELKAGSELLVPQGDRASDPDADEDFHVVVSGDTLSQIAGRYGLRLGELLLLNAIDVEATLRRGTRLRIRADAY